MRQLTFAKGDIIFRQGDFANVMYDIVSGKVGIYSDYQGEQEKLIAELGDGQILGEMGMIEAYPRSATAVALSEQVVLSELVEADLDAYFKDDPTKVLLLMRQLSERLRETTRKYTELCGAVSRHKKAEEQGDEQPELLQELDRYAKFYSEHWVD